MPVAPTYPGVYIEEVPSGVHTITGVATSITAFIGFTPRGSVNEPIRIFSFADFERAFGGLSTDSPLSYCVRDFFQNGGTEAYVVRVASGAKAASIIMRSATADVLKATAAGDGTWGNNLRLEVDYATANPDSMFNLRVVEFVNQNGAMVPGRTELFRNLTLNSADGSYAVDAVNAGSDLVKLALATGLAVSGTGTSTSATITAAELTAFPATLPANIAFTLDGQGPFETTIPASAANTTALIQAAVVKAVNDLIGGTPVTGGPASTTTISVVSAASSKSSIHFIPASSDDAAVSLHLGLTNGGTEVDGAASFRPRPSGTTGTVDMTLTGATTGTLTIDVKSGAAAAKLKTITLPIWGALPLKPIPTTLDELAQRIQAAMDDAATAAPEPFLVGAIARRAGTTLQIVPGPGNPNLSFDFGTTTAALLTKLGLDAAGARNVARYAPGVGEVAFAQAAPVSGNNGTAPTAGDLQGKASLKTGIYALENVDLFNILVMPDATKGAGLMNVLTEAIAYCTRRRAFMVIDVPDQVTDFQAVSSWITGSASPLRSRNAAMYWPRIKQPDPMMNGIVGNFAAAGAVAGLYARTDAERGVWKAPAGITALINGAVGLSYTMTDGENGALNPVGLNCFRTFPVIGTIAWGARTARGADALADEYKYVPVRRLALYLEESLYRGTQWAVFEPNDEPLWAQIRLNLGAFMHTLFAQGAFQGKTPREAYFVKCDKETTTQNDIDLGRVNIVVGFAPLKPAEFVIIRFQQIAGAIQT